MGYIVRFILLFSILFPAVANATVKVVKFPSGTPVDACQALDANPDCTKSSGGVAGYWTGSGNNIYNNNTANVGVGTSSAPSSTFQVTGTSLIGPSAINATGGTVTTVSGNQINTFTSNGTFTPSASGTVNIIMVGGGGGGGLNQGGGGGAGGVLTGTYAVTAGVPISVTIGAGGAGTTNPGTYPSAGVSGGDTVFGTATALGGGGGAAGNPPNTGGSGGGGGSNSRTGAASTQGNSGGLTGVGFSGGTQNAANNSTGAGGGGAGGAGAANSGTTGGAGGAGISSSLSGVAVTYACGGGGDSDTTTGGAGGCASAGNGSTSGGAATSASANSGSGGGGSGASPAGSGGSGIVIVSYPASSFLKVSSAGNVGVSQLVPVSALDVNGGVTVGSYSGVNTAPANGMIVSGNVGIGTATPLGGLTVMGNVGIGTWVPTNGLHIKQPASGVLDLAYLVNSNGQAGDDAGIGFANTTGGGLTGVHARISATRTNRGTSGDTDLRFWTLGSGTLAERMRISDTGNVGIGTVTTTGAQFNIHGASTSNAGFMRIALSNGNGGTVLGNASASFTGASGASFGIRGPDIYMGINATPTFYMNSSGNIGINTVTPTAPLSIGAAGATSGINILVSNLSRLNMGADSNDSNINAATGNNLKLSNGTVTQSFIGANVGIGTVAPATTLQVDSSAPSFRIGDATTATSPSLQLYAGSSSHAYQFVANTNINGVEYQESASGGGAGGFTTRLALVNGGNVGVGTLTASAKMTVNGDINLDGSNNRQFAVVPTSDGSSQFDFDINAPLATGTAQFRVFRSTQTGGATAAFDVFKANASTTINSRIAGTGSSYLNADNGNVGIGSITPGAKFDVAGNLRTTAGGHLISTGTAPTVANNDCGTTVQGTVVAKSTDNTGTVTVGTLAVTSCAITFASAWSVAPNCIVIDDTNILTVRPGTVSTTKLTINSTTSMSGDNVTWICHGNE